MSDVIKDVLMGKLFGGSCTSSGGGIPQEDIDAAFAALAEKGVTVPDGATSADLDDLIASIEAHGGAAAYGSVTPTQTGAVPIEHGLGKAPDFLVVAAAAAPNSTNFPDNYAIYTLSTVMYGAQSKALHCVHVYNGELVSHTHAGVTSTYNSSLFITAVDETCITVGVDGAYSYGLQSGVSYTWLAGCYK